MNALRLWLHALKLRTKTMAGYQNKDWRTLPIKECGEPLVLASQELCHPYYSKEMGITSEERIFLRQTTLNMFYVAKEICNSLGYDLKIYDGWRSMQLQENLFWFYMKEFTAKKFNSQNVFLNIHSPTEIKAVFNKNIAAKNQVLMIQANKAYVSLPSSDPKSPSPHSTGGAVDVWLYKDGQSVDLGVPFDWMEKNAGAFYHIGFRKKKFPKNHKLISKNRNILLYAMSQSGFSCYPPEIWHFNFGNQMDSLISTKTAQYSYTEPSI